MTTRVMLVDDAVVVRHVLTDTLKRDPELEIVGTAADGKLALEKLPSANPDVVVLDVEMPNMDGIETLAVIKKLYPKIKVIMFSTLTSRGAGATMDALMHGADDYVCKPANVNSIADAIGQIKEELVPRIKALHHRTISAIPPAVAAPAISGIAPSPTRITPPTTVRTSHSGGRPQIIAIAISTGGPNALASLLPQLPSDLAVPIVIVQHIPPMFSKALADRLNAQSALQVAECEPGAALLPGHVWIAPGDYHMVVERDASTTRVTTHQGPPENSCRPAADVLFRSVATVFGANALGVVMTGMGSDGLKGAQELIRSGSKVIIQDEASSVVWGMPGAVAHAGIADKTLPLDQLANEIVSRVGTSKPSITVTH